MRFLILSFFIFTSVFASIQVSFSKGWSLASIPKNLTDMSLFDNKSVEIIWGYDAEKQKWQGYSPDSILSQKIADKNIATLESLSSYQAFWILSKEDWNLDIGESSLKEINNNTILLREGWNLISLPQRVVVDDAFFGDALVWKYNEELGWSVNDATLDFPTIKEMKNSDGLWVKSEGEVEIDMSEALSQLHTFTTDDEMLTYIREMLQANQYFYYDDYVYATNGGVVSPMALEDNTVDTVQDTTTTDATTTNLQEEGVDESDIVKNDGEYLFSIDNTNAQIYINSLKNISQSNYKAINTIALNDKNVVAMYLQNSRLILISNSTYYGDYYILDAEFSAKKSLPYYNNTQSLSVDIYDVSDVLNIKLLSSYTLDGNYQESRVVDGKLFLISSFYPEIIYDYPKIYEEGICSTLDINAVYSSCSDSTPVTPSILYAKEAAVCENGDDYELYYSNECYKYNYDELGVWKYDYDNPTIASESLTPNITQGSLVTSLITPSKLYAPVKLNQNATLTSLSSFDIEDSGYNESISFVGNTHTYYASQTSFYLVSSEYPLYYDYDNYKEQQMIYKFGIGDSLEYRARGFVDGRMLNQFSMSEQDEYLRVATSSGFSWGGNPTVNSVFTMKESSESLEVRGKLSGLGKEGELIKAVRFMGDKGFVVTFKQTDPLYTLDMSNPEVPKVVGELSIPGFSNYLHIVDENRVLSIGRDANEDGTTLGLMLQLFDISDFSHPQLADKLLIGTHYTYSPAEYNHKAFVFRSSDMMFGLPYTEYDYSSYNYSATENFGVYQLEGMSISEVKTLTQESSDNYWGSEKRGLIFDINSSSYAALIEGANIVSDSLEEGK